MKLIGVKVKPPMEAVEFLIALLIVITLPTDSECSELICDEQDQVNYSEDWRISSSDNGDYFRIAGMWIENEIQFK